MRDPLQAPTSDLPLSGITVVDLSSVWAIPGAAMYLADQGANVIKVEPPGGDIGRTLLAAPPIANRSRAFWMLNRNKRSVVLDLKKPGGIDALMKLIGSADVVMHNFRPGVAERLGFGYDDVSAANQRAIFVSFSAWGPAGPKSDSRGYDLLLQARSGILARKRDEQGRPQPAGLFAVDMASSMMIAYAVTLALLHRERTGKGQQIEGSLLQTAVALQKNDLVRLVGHDEPPYDGALVDLPIFNAYECADGEYIQIAIISDAEWNSLVRALGLDQTTVEQQFSTREARQTNARALGDLLSTLFGSRTTAEWEPILDSNDVPAQRVYHSNDVFADPQLHANDALIRLVQPGVGEIEMPGVPFKLHDTGEHQYTPAPELGAHTREVLLSHGYSENEFKRLVESGAAVGADETPSI
jgi:crotonobetainyl-CoA:carnitine CoA-transferase CaiB-like acyl-CoA transferase